MASSNEPRFECILTSDPERPPNNTEPLYLDREEGKKSSFQLNLNRRAANIDKPAHVLLQCSPHDKFLFGGLEIVSNARNVEIYLTGEDGKEEYLTTCRGIKAGDDDDHDVQRFKCLVVCPGGPRPVTRVHLKLLSLKPATCTGACLHLLKFKGRLPPPKQDQVEEQVPNDSEATRQAVPPSNNAPASASPGLTQADMGAAMAGVSMLVRSVESSLVQSIHTSLDRMERKFDARFDRIEQYLMLQHQQAMVQQQQQNERHNALQNQVMTQTKKQQSELVALIESLQSQLDNPRDDDRNSNTNEDYREMPSESEKKSSTTDDSEVDREKETEEVESVPSQEESSEIERAIEMDESPAEATTTEEVSATDTVLEDDSSTSIQDHTKDTIEPTIFDETREGSIDSEPEADTESTSEIENAADVIVSDSMDAQQVTKNINELKEGGKNESLESHEQIEPGVDPSVQPVATLRNEKSEEPHETSTDDHNRSNKIIEEEKNDVREISAISASDDGSEPAKRLVVMNQRADAFEIPELLPDDQVNGMPLTGSVSSSSPKPK